MPEAFKNPKLNEPGKTNYLAVVGRECVFDGSPQGLGLKHITDGTSRTLALVEANADQAVEWTRPQDWNFDRQQPTKGLGSLWRDGWYAARVDGSIPHVDNSEPADQVGIQFTRAGGEQASLQESAELKTQAPSPATQNTQGLENEVDSQPSAVEQLPLIFSLKRNGQGEPQLYLNEKPIDEAELRSLIKDQGQPSDDQPVSLSADTGMSYTDVIKIVDLLQSLGFKKLALDTRHVEATVGQVQLEPNQELQDLASVQSPAAQKSEPDNWPMGVVFPSPKEGEISKRAWKRLGLKLVVATGSSVGRVQIMGGPFVQSAEAPVIITAIDTSPIANFEDLATFLAKLTEDKSVLVACTSHGKENERDVSFVVERPGKFTGFSVHSDSSALLHAIVPTPAQSKFPSLEDQKLADLAWKRLGLELESISGDDLKRVQALGFEGGLKVTGAGIELQQQQGVRKDDILVGLHVWPTTSLPQVAEVLNREDLAQFNPLKYYVVRFSGSNRSGGGFGGVGVVSPEVDTVFTGRISVKSERPPQPALMRAPALPSAGQPTSAPPTPAPAQDRYNWANPPSTPRYSPAPTQVVPTWPTTSPQTGGGWNQPRVAVADPQPAAEAPTRSLLVEPSRQPTYERPVPGPAEVEEDVLIPSTLAPTRAPLPTPTPTMIAQVPRPAGAANKKANLRYNDQTFAEWSDAWRTELSTEKRLEAVKALAAFGRAGYGQEATEAILDVAGEYDFSFLDGDQNEEGKLKDVVLAELAPEYRSHSLAKYWVPDLTKRLEKEPKKWQGLAIFLLYRLKSDDPDVVAILQSLAQNGPGEVRHAALGALVRSGQSRDGAVLRVDDKTRELLATALKSEDVDAVRSALWLLLYYPPNAGSSAEPQLVFLPELVPLLFYADEGIRKQARKTLRSIEEKNAAPAVQELVAVLNDPSRNADHIEAIRALAVMGQNAKSTIPKLREILASSDADNPLRYAAAVALENIDNPNFPKVLIEVLGKELEVNLNENEQINWFSQPKERRFMAGVEAEREQLIPPQHPGQGGGGFGGGGGGGFF